MELITPLHWKNYELLDCGDFEKLERFGEYVTIRPEPQAVWPKVWSDAEWKNVEDLISETNDLVNLEKSPNIPKLKKCSI